MALETDDSRLGRLEGQMAQAILALQDARAEVRAQGTRIDRLMLAILGIGGGLIVGPAILGRHTGSATGTGRVTPHGAGVLTGAHPESGVNTGTGPHPAYRGNSLLGVFLTETVQYHH